MTAVHTWAGLTGPPPEDHLVDLAERLTGALSEVEVIRLLAEEVERRVRPSHWCLVVGDRHELRVEHVGGRASARLLRYRLEPGESLVWRTLEAFQAHVVEHPASSSLASLRMLEPPPEPEDAVLLPFGGYEVVGCLEMVDVLRVAPPYRELEALRRVLRLGGVGIRNARRHQRLAGESVDATTGLEGPNRFRTALEHELQRTARNTRPTTVLLVDLDGFKKVNHEHGRLFGSSLLAEVGAILQLSVRRVDLATRWAGDTFALLLPETPEAGARTVAERVQRSIRERPFSVGSPPPLHLTASVGIALFERRPSDPEQVLHEVEVGMRQAQTSGSSENLCFARAPS